MIAGEVQIAERSNAAVHTLDRATIRRNGDVARAWFLVGVNTSKPDGIAYTKTLEEFDCVNDMGRIVYVAEYDENGNSLNVAIATKAEWVPIITG